MPAPPPPAAHLGRGLRLSTRAGSPLRQKRCHQSTQGRKLQKHLSCRAAATSESDAPPPPSSAVEAPLLVRGRLIGFLSSNIQPRLCSRELEGHPGLWVVLSLLTVG